MTERKKRSKERTVQQKLLLHYFQFKIERRKEYQKEDWSLEIREHEKEIERRKENQKEDWSFPNGAFVFRYINMKEQLGKEKKLKGKKSMNINQ